jgi:hypothetical protein
MTTKFISDFSHLGLYCVWIKTGNPRRIAVCSPAVRTSREPARKQDGSVS